MSGRSLTKNQQQAMRLNAKLLNKYLNEVNELLPQCDSDGVVFIADISLLLAWSGQESVRNLLAKLWQMPVPSPTVQHLLASWGNESRPLVFATPLAGARILMETITPDAEAFIANQADKQPHTRCVVVIANNTISCYLLRYRLFAEDGQHRVGIRF